MDAILNYILWGALLLHISLVMASIWRVWRGENIIDRLIGLDVTTTLVLVILVLIGIIDKSSMFIDIAIGLAALSAIGSVALAKFIADHRMF
jgi:multisubunit Na+/H+ antiporter MnhF subunit